MAAPTTAATNGPDAIAIVKEAAVAAVIAVALFLPLVGFHTVDQGGVLGIETRFDWLAIGVGAVFLGRLALATYRETRARRPSPGAFAGMGARLEAVVQTLIPWVAAAVIVFAFALPFLPFSNRYVIDVATTVLIYVMLGWGLNIVVGLAGLLDLGYVAFYAVGAYSYALMAVTFDLSFWVCLPLAGLFAATAGVILGFPVLRLRGDYLAIVTLGFGEMIRIILINWYPVTRGPDGISGVPRPSFFGYPFTSSPPEGVTAFHQLFDQWLAAFHRVFGMAYQGFDYSGQHRVIFLYFLILLLALVTNLFTLRIRRLPVGRAWEALREDEIACRSLGINPRNTKLTAFGIGAMFAGFAGSFFATRQGFISPESFTFTESATVVAIVVLGGMGSQVGVVVAAGILVLLPELGREFAQFRMLLFGAAMVVIMIWRPRGLLAHRKPTIRLDRPAPAARGAAS
ncbi:MAG TPA: high-affinity branched-chain amino acid ABC transporter permease LivM [Rhodospirillales bacterium]